MRPAGDQRPGRGSRHRGPARHPRPGYRQRRSRLAGQAVSHSAATEAATPSRRSPPTRSRRPQAPRKPARRPPPHPPPSPTRPAQPAHRPAHPPPTRKATPPDAPEAPSTVTASRRGPGHAPRLRNDLRLHQHAPVPAPPGSSPHPSSRRNGSTANAEAQQLRTAAATSSRPTPVTEENAPAHRPSPSSGLDDRTITRPPSASTAPRSSSVECGVDRVAEDFQPTGRDPPGTHG